MDKCLKVSESGKNGLSGNLPSRSISHPTILPILNLISSFSPPKTILPYINYFPPNPLQLPSFLPLFPDINCFTYTLFPSAPSSGELCTLLLHHGPPRRPVCRSLRCRPFRQGSYCSPENASKLNNYGIEEDSRYAHQSRSRPASMAPWNISCR